MPDFIDRPLNATHSTRTTTSTSTSGNASLDRFLESVRVVERVSTGDTSQSANESTQTKRQK